MCYIWPVSPSRIGTVVGGQILRVFDPCTNDLGEPSEKISGRRGNLITTDKPAAPAEPLFDAIVVEDSQNSGCLANSTSTN